MVGHLSSASFLRSDCGVLSVGSATRVRFAVCRSHGGPNHDAQLEQPWKSRPSPWLTLRLHGAVSHLGPDKARRAVAEQAQQVQGDIESGRHVTKRHAQVALQGGAKMCGQMLPTSCRQAVWQVFQSIKCSRAVSQEERVRQTCDATVWCS